MLKDNSVELTRDISTFLSIEVLDVRISSFDAAIFFGVCHRDLFKFVRAYLCLCVKDERFNYLYIERDGLGSYEINRSGFLFLCKLFGRYKDSDFNSNEFLIN